SVAGSTSPRCCFSVSSAPLAPARRCGRDVVTLPFGLGELRVLSPAALWALLAVPVFFAGVRRTRTAAVLRAASAAVVALALGGLSLERPRPAAGTCLVALVDVSARFADAGRQAARDAPAHSVPPLVGEEPVCVVACT